MSMKVTPFANRKIAKSATKVGFSILKSILWQTFEKGQIQTSALDWSPSVSPAGLVNVNKSGIMIYPLNG